MGNSVDKFQLVAGAWLKSSGQLQLPLTQPWPVRLLKQEEGWKEQPEGGFNVFLLMHEAAQRKLESAYWIALRDGEKAGGKLREDAQGVTVAAWRWTAKSESFKGDVTEKMAYAVEEAPEGVEAEGDRAIAMRPVVLFNASEWEGLTLPAEPEIALPTYEQALAAAEETEVAGAGCEVRIGGTTAFYNPSLNYIQMPPKESFKSLKEYYWTLFEQIGHALAGKTQMNLWEGHGGVDFSKDVEVKNLYAKMVAAMMAYEAGIDVL